MNYFEKKLKDKSVGYHLMCELNWTIEQLNSNVTLKRTRFDGIQIKVRAHLNVVQIGG